MITQLQEVTSTCRPKDGRVKGEALHLDISSVYLPKAIVKQLPCIRAFVQLRGHKSSMGKGLHPPSIIEAKYILCLPIATGLGCGICERLVEGCVRLSD